MNYEDYEVEEQHKEIFIKQDLPNIFLRMLFNVSINHALLFVVDDEIIHNFSSWQLKEEMDVTGILTSNDLQRVDKLYQESNFEPFDDVDNADIIKLFIEEHKNKKIDLSKSPPYIATLAETLVRLMIYRDIYFKEETAYIILVKEGEPILLVKKWSYYDDEINPDKVKTTNELFIALEKKDIKVIDAYNKNQKDG